LTLSLEWDGVQQGYSRATPVTPAHRSSAQLWRDFSRVFQHGGRGGMRHGRPWGV